MKTARDKTLEKAKDYFLNMIRILENETSLRELDFTGQYGGWGQTDTIVEFWTVKGVPSPGWLVVTQNYAMGYVSIGTLAMKWDLSTGEKLTPQDVEEEIP